MERLMLPPTPILLTQNLHQTNDRLRFWLDSLAPEHAQPAPATPEQMAGFLSELLRAGEWLRSGLPQGKNPDLQTELCEYRMNVERLRELLPSIHRQLLSERSRLEAARAQVESAGEWARVSRQTL
jgi:hypothetical protein